MGRIRWGILTLLFVCAGFTSQAAAQVETIAKRPYYELTASLHPTRLQASGTLLLRYVNQTGEDLHRIVFAMDNPQDREDLITRVRVNRRPAEITYFHKDQGAPFDGFELDAKRSLPPDVVSEIDLDFVSRTAVEYAGLVLYQGDWFPRILGPAEADIDPADRSLMDVDGTIDYPVEWRGALSGLILREDAIGERVELFNAAAKIKNYGIIMGRDLRIVEDELYGISVRTFAPPEDVDWGSRVQRQVTEVVEYYKRRTPVTPPLILNVVPDDSQRSHADVLFANTVTLPYRSDVPAQEIGSELGRAVTELYWGFGGARSPGGSSNSLEKALSLYGMLLWSREAGRDSTWMDQWDSRFHAGLMARHHSAILGPIGEDAENGFASEVGTANAFLTLRMMEHSLPAGALEKAYDQAIVQHVYDQMDPERLRAILAEQGYTPQEELLTALDEGLPVMDATIVYSENRGLVLDAWVTEVTVQRTASEAFPIPVGVIQTDGSQVISVLEPNLSSLIIRSPLPPMQVLIDPKNTLPLLNSSGRDVEAVALVARALYAEDRYGELRELIDQLHDNGLSPDGEVVYLWAEALLKTGQYGRARDILHEAVRSGNGDRFFGDNLLLLGKCYDLLGQRAQAVEAYRSAANHIGVSAEATGLISAPFTQKR